MSFITIEGVDGVGKSSVIEKLKSYFIENKIESVFTREPGGTDYAEKQRTLLKDPQYNLSPRAQLFGFQSARADHVDKVIVPALNDGKIVVCDRFYDSTMIYQQSSSLSPEFINEMSLIATNGLKPDLTLIFDVSFETADKRKNLRADVTLDAFDNKPKKEWLAMREKWQKLAVEPRCEIISGEGSVDEVFERTLKVLENRGILALPDLNRVENIQKTANKTL